MRKIGVDSISFIALHLSFPLICLVLPVYLFIPLCFCDRLLDQAWFSEAAGFHPSHVQHPWSKGVPYVHSIDHYRAPLHRPNVRNLIVVAVVRFNVVESPRRVPRTKNELGKEPWSPDGYVFTSELLVRHPTIHIQLGSEFGLARSTSLWCIEDPWHCSSTGSLAAQRVLAPRTNFVGFSVVLAGRGWQPETYATVYLGPSSLVASGRRRLGSGSVEL